MTAMLSILMLYFHNMFFPVFPVWSWIGCIGDIFAMYRLGRHRLDIIAEEQCHKDATGSKCLELVLQHTDVLF